MGSPGQHFLGRAHAQANVETAFYRSTAADNNSVEQWQAEGALDTASRANALRREPFPSAVQFGYHRHEFEVLREMSADPWY